MTDVVKTMGAALGTAAEADLEAINRLTKTRLTAEEVYTFAIRLCDNLVDRDFERFTTAALERLGELFVGKSGIFDHNWSAQGQTARIYRTELVREPEAAAETGEGACYLKGYAYMLRSEKNAALIQEIDGGIKKEVSVGCSVAKRSCSICGCTDGSCGHQPGRRYDGKLCFLNLEEPTDAYEWSFVAVPAQRQAGVLRKSVSGAPASLREAVEKAGGGSLLGQLDRLEREAELGRGYLEALRQEVVRLAGLAEEDLDCGIFKGIAQRMDQRELLELRRIYRRRVDRKLAGGPQLGQRRKETAGEDAFLV